MTQNYSIKFSDIPRTSKLYKDFLYDFSRVSRFYQPEGLDIPSLTSRVAKVTAQTFSRDAVADVLKEQNTQAGAGEATFANIERLRQSDSVVIITGQQAGLFTGPLYTIFKALTAIKLAEHLRTQGVNAVPMFWIAAEDHDFQEVNHTRLVNREGQIVTITYTACSPKEGKPVGHVRLADGISENIDQLIAALPESEFVPRLAEDLRDSYKAGASFADAFGKMMMKLFGQYGVVLINPLDDRFKHVSGEIYSRAMSNGPEFANRLVTASAQLEAAGYHSQVYTSQEAVPLFMLDEGRRTAMVRREDGRFYLKGGDKSFASDEMLSTVLRCPNCFSPNVTLRPIVQDFLLPTLAYIGGPAEIAYFAQLRPNYSLLNRVEPVVLPRATFTLIEKRHAKTMAKYGIEFKDLFDGPESVLKKVVEQSLDNTTTRIFDETEKLIDEQLEKLRASLIAVDPTLGEAVKGGRDKVFYQLNNLRTRFINTRGKRDDTTKQQIERLFAVLYPNKNLQEREINVAYFLARYGYDLIDRLYQEVEIGNNDHKLVYL
jgi:bacillithiol biosynthesis cysteine-adding enzyme BshC